MKENEKEDKPLRNTISFGKNLNRNLKNENLDNRIRSSSLSSNKLLENFIPKLKPIMANINPSPITLINKEETKIEEENFRIETTKRSSQKLKLLKIKSMRLGEEINERIGKSDEYFCHGLPCEVSDSSDTESKERDNKINKNNDINKDKNDNNITKIKKNVNYCIGKLRRKMDKIRNSINIKTYKDDSNIENYRNKCAQKIINQIKMEKMNEFWKSKNKSVSFNFKKFKPPILGFLQMNEASANSTLSSCNISEI